MANFLGILVLLAFLAIPVALVKPGAILWRAEKPSLVKALAITIAVFTVLVGVWVRYLPQPEKTAQAPAPAQQAVATKPAPKGIGISRAQAAAVLGGQGCVIAKSSEVDGQERWQGNSNVVLCEVIGPEREVQKVFLLNGISKDNPAGALDAIVRLNEVVKLAAPEWADSGKWVLAAIKKEGDRTTRNGRLIEVKLFQGLGVGASIEAAQ